MDVMYIISYKIMNSVLLLFPSLMQKVMGLNKLQNCCVILLSEM